MGLPPTVTRLVCAAMARMPGRDPVTAVSSTSATPNAQVAAAQYADRANAGLSQRMDLAINRDEGRSIPG